MDIRASGILPSIMISGPSWFSLGLLMEFPLLDVILDLIQLGGRFGPLLPIDIRPPRHPLENGRDFASFLFWAAT